MLMLSTDAKCRFRQSQGVHTEFSSGLVPHGFPWKRVWSCELDFPLRRIPVCLLSFGEGLDLPQGGVPALISQGHYATATSVPQGVA